MFIFLSCFYCFFFVVMRFVIRVRILLCVRCVIFSVFIGSWVLFVFTFALVGFLIITLSCFSLFLCFFGVSVFIMFFFFDKYVFSSNDLLEVCLNYFFLYIEYFVEVFIKFLIKYFLYVFSDISILIFILCIFI